jgi:hypothetical protein
MAMKVCRSSYRSTPESRVAMILGTMLAAVLLVGFIHISQFVLADLVKVRATIDRLGR